MACPIFRSLSFQAMLVFQKYDLLDTQPLYALSTYEKQLPFFIGCGEGRSISSRGCCHCSTCDGDLGPLPSIQTCMAVKGQNNVIIYQSSVWLPGKVISNTPSVNQVNGTKRLDPYLLYLSVIKTLPLNSASVIGHLFLFCKTLLCHIYLKEGELQLLQNFLTGPYLNILICTLELIPPLYPRLRVVPHFSSGIV